MKSTTIRPPRSRSRSWRATSSAASRLVRNAVSSMSWPLVARAELTSIDDQRLGVVDHDRAARGQVDVPAVGALDLVLDLEAREERHVVAVQLDLADVGRHHGLHEGDRLVVDLLRVDQDLADVGLEVVADRADHQARFEVDQERLLLGVLGGAVDRGPQLQQVVQVPLQFFGRAADRGGARDHAHAFRDHQLVDGVAQLVAVLALDAARDAAAARVVRHQDQVASREADEGGEGGALVAALVLLDLDDQVLAFAEGILDAGAADVDAGAEIAARDFLERQEPVPLFTVVDERGLEAGLDAGDDALVDVALALFPGGRLDVEVDQFLSFDDGDAQFFLLGRVKQHAFHLVVLLRAQERCLSVGLGSPSGKFPAKEKATCARFHYDRCFR